MTPQPPDVAAIEHLAKYWERPSELDALLQTHILAMAEYIRAVPALLAAAEAAGYRRGVMDCIAKADEMQERWIIRKHRDVFMELLPDEATR